MTFIEATKELAENRTSLVFEWWSGCHIVWFLNGPPNHMIRPFENCIKKCLKSHKFRFKWLLNLN